VIYFFPQVFEVMSAEGEGASTQDNGQPKDAMQLMLEEEERRKRKPFKVTVAAFPALCVMSHHGIT
jgi:hypothetical protein